MNSKRLKALVTPLDWGLGHATRCIPIIKNLIDLEIEVLVAAHGAQKTLLSEEFPDLEFFDLPGYGIRYGDRRWSFGLKIMLQVPKILIQINREKRWLEAFLRSKPVDLVISDNRYGLFSSKIFSVFITHQLHISTPFGKSISRILTSINYQYIGKFDACWIPDFEDVHRSLAGRLSHPSQLPATSIRYIGLLSRLHTIQQAVIKNLLIVIISGPEPQRSIFEKKILVQLKLLQGKIILIRGLPGSDDKLDLQPNITAFNHASAEMLNNLICESEFVLARSGYSTVMDVVSLKKKCILVPTRGQPEQEYLAQYLFDKKMILTVREEELDLKTCIANAGRFPFSFVEIQNDLLKHVLNDTKDRLVQKELADKKSVAP